jgi:hypothetical protein
MHKIFSKLLKYSGKCAKLQTINLNNADAYLPLIDKEVNKLKGLGIDFKFKCKNKIYSSPVNCHAEHFRPLFKMATHAKIKEARADDSNAVDFDVPVGTEVFAVESGVITAIQSDSNIGGNDPIYSGKDNYLYVINKKENLIFCYRHLESSNKFSVNNYIGKGMLIGRVGLTGYVISPHLHFAVYEINLNKKYILESIPIIFII